MPNTGKELSIIGNTAQCMAQAADAAMPIASQFIFIFIFRSVKIVYLQ